MLLYLAVYLPRPPSPRNLPVRQVGNSGSKRRGARVARGAPSRVQLPLILRECSRMGLVSSGVGNLNAPRSCRVRAIRPRLHDPHLFDNGTTRISRRSQPDRRRLAITVSFVFVAVPATTNDQNHTIHIAAAVAPSSLGFA